MSEEIIKINLQNHIVSLKVQTFDGEIDIEDILKIDFTGIRNEIVTFPVIMNRLGLLRADQEEVTSRSKLDFEIYEAQLTEEKRKSLTSSDTDEKGKTKVSKPTKDEVDNAVLLDVRYRKKKEQYFANVKWMSYLDSVYWSAKDKSTKLDKLSEKLRPEEFEKELLEGVWNGVLIKCQQKLIQQKQK